MTSPTSHSLFRLLPGEAGASKTVDIFFNDMPMTVPAGRSVAATLLAAGISRFRSTPVSGQPRAPYCMMGACFECLVEIDGVGNRQSCMVQVRDGMQIRAQEGARDLPLTTLTTLDDASTEHTHER